METPFIFQQSANDSSLRAETGILAQPTSVNGSRYLPMPQQNRTTASVIIDPKTGVDIFPDVLGEMRKLCKKVR